MLEIPRQMNERPFDLFVAFFQNMPGIFPYLLGLFDGQPFLHPPSICGAFSSLEQSEREDQSGIPSRL